MSAGMGVERIGTLTIANGQTTSGLLSALLSAGQMKLLGSLEQLTIIGPAALTNAVAVQFAPDCPGTSWAPAEDFLGNAITAEAAVAVGIPYLTFKDLRLVSAGAEGAERVFTLLGKFALPGS